MRRALLASLLLFSASLASAAEIRGTWTMLVDGDHVQFGVMRSGSNWSRTMARSDFTLTDAQMTSSAETPVHFAMARDAGTIDFRGTFQSGEGVGRFVFTPNGAYVQTLRSLGVSTGDPLEDDDLFSLALHDVSTGFIQEMQSLGLREDLRTYVRFRIHGVTPETVRALRDLGYTPDGQEIVRFRIHGVTPEFVKAMRDLGVTGLSSGDLVRLRIHGATADFVRELRDLGYTGLDAGDLVRMRIHGVTPEFIRELAAAGYRGIPTDKLVQMRIRGITADMLKKSQ